ncbi:MAG: MATE family efflux transporter [Candidatus Krumholzibacteriales bacterium]
MTNLKNILKTSVPIVVDLGSQIVMWTVETTLVGHIAVNSMRRLYPGMNATGVDALTAVGNVVQIVLYTCTILLIFVFGATIIVNRLLGEKKKEEANHFLGQTLFTALVPAFVIAAIWRFGSPFIFSTVLGASDVVTVIGVDYFRIVSMFAPFIIMNFVAIGIVRGAGDTHLSMMTALVVNGIHLVLAICLIYGKFFFPELGVRGAALAAGIGHTTGFILTFSVILRGRSVLTFQWEDLTAINLQSIKGIIKTGIPITLEQLAWMTGVTIVIGYSNRLGTVAAAAHIIILTYQRIFSILYQAFGMGALTLVGQRFGANAHDEIRQTSKTLFMLAVGLVLILSGVIFFRSRYLPMLFTDDRMVIDLCSTVFKIVAFVQIPKALSFLFSFSLRGVGENRYPMYLAFIGIFFFEVVFGYTLAFIFSLSIAGLWIAAVCDETFKSVLTSRKFIKKINSIELDVSEE